MKKKNQQTNQNKYHFTSHLWILWHRWHFTQIVFAFCTLQHNTWLILSNKLKSKSSSSFFSSKMSSKSKYSSINLTNELNTHPNLRSSCQFFMVKIGLSKFSMPRQQCLKPMIIPTILKILSILIYRPTIPKICFAKKLIFRNCCSSSTH